MSFQRINLNRTALSVAVAALMGMGSAHAAYQWHDTGTVSLGLKNLVADFDGRMFGALGNGQYTDMLCSDTPTWWNAPTCDADHPPITGDLAPKLYPIDSEFGFHVVPYALAIAKEIGDSVWGEGYAGNVVDNGVVVGIELSDAATDFFKVPAGWGTWCAGLGGTSVKCSTEHYTTMEHVLTCHETVAYVVPTDTERADPNTGTQGVIEYVEDGVPGSLDCATTQLDNDLLIHNSTNPDVDGKKLSELIWADGYDLSNPLDWMAPNEATVLDMISVGDDYTMTAKDDGKPLYRWGTLIKKPNDIRLYVRMKLPDAWKDGSCDGINIEPGTGRDLGCRVRSGRLTLDHAITNNPNDQIRPEDMENEAAIGRQPGFDWTPDYGTGSRVSDVACYEGDGHFIDVGTVLRNANMAEGAPNSLVANDWDYVNADGNPYGWSSDLRKGFSNAWYTTVDREPFEWSYDTDGDGAADESYRAPLANPLPAGTTLLTGPRWRMTPPKFGQDIPGLEVPVVNCAPPPYLKEMIKYERGVRTLTVIDLMDWSSADGRSVIDPDSLEPVSPLRFTNGWVDGDINGGQLICDGGNALDPSSAAGECDAVTVVNPNLTAVTTNGNPVSEDFDLALYVKGDKKPIQLYNLKLAIGWDDGVVAP